MEDTHTVTTPTVTSPTIAVPTIIVPARSPKLNRFQPEQYDTVVIYHAGCPDGVASAFAFTCSDRFGKVYYHHAVERDFARDAYMPKLDNKHVYVVDFSYPKATLETIRGIAKSIHVFDHHKTAYEDLKDLPYCVFDMERCGAEITWDELYCSQLTLTQSTSVSTLTQPIPPPWFMKHIRDRDLWKWEHPNSREFSAVFRDDGYRIEVLEKYAKYTDTEINALYTRGALLIDFESKLVTNLCAGARKIKFEGYTVFALNSPLYGSECGNELVKRDCAFALIYSHDTGTGRYSISLRGKPEAGIDLSAIAKKYGGGGHPLASGFAWDKPIEELFMSERK